MSVHILINGGILRVMQIKGVYFAQAPVVATGVAR